MRAPLSPDRLAAAVRTLENPKAWTNELRKRYRKVGTKYAGRARNRMRSGPAWLGRAAGAVRGGATATAATIKTGGRSVPGAAAAIYGTKGPTGWLGGWRNGVIEPNRRAGFAEYRNQPPWVRADWTVATKGEGPRGINDQLADDVDDIREDFAEAAFEMFSRAFGR